MARGIRQAAGGEEVSGGPAKGQLRRDVRGRIGRLSAGERAAGSGAICQRVRAQAFWKAAGSVLLFAPLPGEINIWPLLELALTEKKMLALPRYQAAEKEYVAAQVQDLENDLVAAKFEIHEPAAHCGEMGLAQVDLALVPGVAFDLQGHRVGRGKGFYDRLLANFRGCKCGVAWEEQIMEVIVPEEHDVCMDLLITPVRILQAKG